MAYDKIFYPIYECGEIKVHFDIFIIFNFTKTKLIPIKHDLPKNVLHNLWSNKLLGGNESISK